MPPTMVDGDRFGVWGHSVGNGGGCVHLHAAAVHRTCRGNLAHPQVGVLIVGAGPTGLGAATRLHQLGYDNFLLIDKVH